MLYNISKNRIVLNLKEYTSNLVDYLKVELSFILYYLLLNLEN